MGCQTTLGINQVGLIKEKIPFSREEIVLSIMLDKNMMLKASIINNSNVDYCVSVWDFPKVDNSPLEFFPMYRKFDQDSPIFIGPRKTYFKSGNRTAKSLYEDFQKVPKHTQLKRHQNLLELYKLRKTGELMVMRFNLKLYKCSDLKTLYDTDTPGYPIALNLKNQTSQFKY